MISEVTRWLAGFEKALSSSDKAALEGLFRPDAHWRDRVALTWRVKTVSGASGLIKEITSHGHAAGARGFEIDPRLLTSGFYFANLRDYLAHPVLVHRKRPLLTFIQLFRLIKRVLKNQGWPHSPQCPLRGRAGRPRETRPGSPCCLTRLRRPSESRGSFRIGAPRPNQQHQAVFSVPSQRHPPPSPAFGPRHTGHA